MKPVDYLVENRDWILPVYRKTGSPKKTFAELKNRLPSSIKEATFRQYLPIVDSIYKVADNEIDKLTQSIKKLTDENAELKEQINKLAQSQKGSRSIDGCTVQKTGKYYYLKKSYGGKVYPIYLGREIDEGKAREKIKAKVRKLVEEGIINQP